MNYHEISKSTGQIGEEIATDFLRQKKYTIRANNYKLGTIGEIDIVCEKHYGIWPFRRKMIVFVEVKTIAGYKPIDGSFLPENHIDAHKRHKLASICKLYISKYHPDSYWRIDVIALVIHRLTQEILYIRHYENAIIDQ